MTIKNGVQPFNLQLFAEGEATPDNPVQPAIEQATVVGTEQAPAGESLAVEVDSSGQRRVVRVPAGTKPGEPVKEQETKPEEESKPEEADSEPEEVAKPEEGPAPYTPEEIASAEDIRTLDAKRIPEALQPMYKAMVAGMNKKFQEAAAQKKALEEVAQTLNKTVEQVKQPQQPQMSQAEFYEKLHSGIKAEVAKRFGLDPATLPDSTSEWPDPMKLAYSNINNELAAKAAQQRQQKQQEQERQQAFKSNADAIEAELRKADAEAYEYVEGKLKNRELSVKEMDVIREALASNDKDAVNKVFNKYRDEFRGVKKSIEPPAKPAAKAPALESGGKGVQPQASATVLDAVFLSKFKNASSQDKVKLIGEWRRSLKK